MDLVPTFALDYEIFVAGNDLFFCHRYNGINVRRVVISVNDSRVLDMKMDDNALFLFTGYVLKNAAGVTGPTRFIIETTGLSDVAQSSVFNIPLFHGLEAKSVLEDCLLQARLTYGISEVSATKTKRKTAKAATAKKATKTEDEEHSKKKEKKEKKEKPIPEEKRKAAARKRGKENPIVQVKAFIKEEGGEGFVQIADDDRKALFIYNDNVDQFADKTYCLTGTGNSAMRPYRAGCPEAIELGYARAVGVPTGFHPGDTVGFKSLGEEYKGKAAKAWIDEAMEELKKLLATSHYGPGTTVYYSAAKDKSGNLGTLTFEVNPIVKAYIVKELLFTVMHHNVQHSDDLTSRVTVVEVIEKKNNIEVVNKLKEAAVLGAKIVYVYDENEGVDGAENEKKIVEGALKMHPPGAAEDFEYSITPIQLTKGWSAEDLLNQIRAAETGGRFSNVVLNITTTDVEKKHVKTVVSGISYFMHLETVFGNFMQLTVMPNLFPSFEARKNGTRGTYYGLPLFMNEEQEAEVQTKFMLLLGTLRTGLLEQMDLSFDNEKFKAPADWNPLIHELNTPSAPSFYAAMKQASYYKSVLHKSYETYIAKKATAAVSAGASINPQADTGPRVEVVRARASLSHVLDLVMKGEINGALAAVNQYTGSGPTEASPLHERVSSDTSSLLRDRLGKIINSGLLETLQSAKLNRERVSDIPTLIQSLAMELPGTLCTNYKVWFKDGDKTLVQKLSSKFPEFEGVLQCLQRKESECVAIYMEEAPATHDIRLCLGKYHPEKSSQVVGFWPKTVELPTLFPLAAAPDPELGSQQLLFAFLSADFQEGGLGNLLELEMSRVVESQLAGASNAIENIDVIKRTATEVAVIVSINDSSVFAALVSKFKHFSCSGKHMIRLQSGSVTGCFVTAGGEPADPESPEPESPEPESPEPESSLPKRAAAAVAALGTAAYGAASATAAAGVKAVGTKLSNAYAYLKGKWGDWRSPHVGAHAHGGGMEMPDLTEPASRLIAAIDLFLGRQLVECIEVCTDIMQRYESQLSVQTWAGRLINAAILYLEVKDEWFALISNLIADGLDREYTNRDTAALQQVQALAQAILHNERRYSFHLFILQCCPSNKSEFHGGPWGEYSLWRALYFPDDVPFLPGRTWNRSLYRYINNEAAATMRMGALIYGYTSSLEQVALLTDQAVGVNQLSNTRAMNNIAVRMNLSTKVDRNNVVVLNKRIVIPHQLSHDEIERQKEYYEAKKKQNEICMTKPDADSGDDEGGGDDGHSKDGDDKDKGKDEDEGGKGKKKSVVPEGLVNDVSSFEYSPAELAEKQIFTHAREAPASILAFQQTFWVQRTASESNVSALALANNSVPMIDTSPLWSRDDVVRWVQTCFLNKEGADDLAKKLGFALCNSKNIRRVTNLPIPPPLFKYKDRTAEQMWREPSPSLDEAFDLAKSVQPFVTDTRCLGPDWRSDMVQRDTLQLIKWFWRGARPTSLSIFTPEHPNELWMSVESSMKLPAKPQSTKEGEEGDAEKAAMKEAMKKVEEELAKASTPYLVPKPDTKLQQKGARGDGHCAMRALLISLQYVYNIAFTKGSAIYNLIENMPENGPEADWNDKDGNTLRLAYKFVLDNTYDSNSERTIYTQLMNGDTSTHADAMEMLRLVLSYKDNGSKWLTPNGLCIMESQDKEDPRFYFWSVLQKNGNPNIGAENVNTYPFIALHYEGRDHYNVFYSEKTKLMSGFMYPPAVKRVPPYLKIRLAPDNERLVLLNNLPVGPISPSNMEYVALKVGSPAFTDVVEIGMNAAADAGIVDSAYTSFRDAQAKVPLLWTAGLLPKYVDNKGFIGDVAATAEQTWGQFVNDNFGDAYKPILSSTVEADLQRIVDSLVVVYPKEYYTAVDVCNHLNARVPVYIASQGDEFMGTVANKKILDRQISDVLHFIPYCVGGYAAENLYVLSTWGANFESKETAEYAKFSKNGRLNPAQKQELRNRTELMVTGIVTAATTILASQEKSAEPTEIRLPMIGLGFYMSAFLDVEEDQYFMARELAAALSTCIKDANEIGGHNLTANVYSNVSNSKLTGIVQDILENAKVGAVVDGTIFKPLTALTFVVNAWDSHSFVGNGLKNDGTIDGKLVAGAKSEGIPNRSYLHNFLCVHAADHLYLNKGAGFVAIEKPCSFLLWAPFTNEQPILSGEFETVIAQVDSLIPDLDNPEREFALVNYVKSGCIDTEGVPEDVQRGGQALCKLIERGADNLFNPTVCAPFQFLTGEGEGELCQTLPFVKDLPAVRKLRSKCLDQIAHSHVTITGIEYLPSKTKAKGRMLFFYNPFDATVASGNRVNKAEMNKDKRMEDADFAAAAKQYIDLLDALYPYPPALTP